jgi:hypothetical protein
LKQRKDLEEGIQDETSILLAGFNFMEDIDVVNGRNKIHWYNNIDVVVIFRGLFFLKLLQITRFSDPIEYWKLYITTFFEYIGLYK